MRGFPRFLKGQEQLRNLPKEGLSAPPPPNTPSPAEATSPPETEDTCGQLADLRTGGDWDLRLSFPSPRQPP